MKKTLSIIKSLLLLLRPKQWVKNVFIFFPAFFAGSIFHSGLLVQLVYIFILFSLFSWATYIFNDILDREKDQLHPKKRFRPIASGKVSLQNAIIWMIFLYAIVLGCIFLYFPPVLPHFLLYGVYSFLYSSFLKKQPLLDIFSLSVGFLIRIWIGAVISFVTPSFWLILIVFFVSVWFGTSKRYQEILLGKDTREVLSHYTKDFLYAIFSMMTVLLIVLYTMYIYEERKETIMLYTIPIFSFGIIRYFYTIETWDDKSRSIEDILLSDSMLLVSALLYSTLTIAALIL